MTTLDARRPAAPLADAPAAGHTLADAAPAASAPWLRLDWDGDRATVRGTPHAVLGGAWGPGGERVPEGTFAEWRWDGTRLVARTDRFGFQPLYLAARGTTLWLSPSLPALVAAGAPAGLDDAALAVFFRLGYFLGDDTPLRAVRRAPPDARVTWERGQLHVEGRRAVAARHAVGRDEGIDRYVALFRDAMARRPVDPARTVVPLTGGRDSRHILVELHAAGRAPAGTVTVQSAPPKSGEDVRVARALAAAVGVPHAALPASAAHRHTDEVAKNWATGLGAFEHYWELSIIRWLAEHGGPRPVVYDGIAGDTLSEAKYMSAHRLDLLRRGDLATYVAEELAPEGYLPKFLPAGAYRRFARGLAKERLTAELRTHLDAPNPVGSYRFWNRTRRGVALAPFGLLAGVAEVRAPFLDDALFDFLAGVPAELLVDRTFHTTAIARGYPAFAGIPYEDPAAPRTPGAAFTRRWTADVGRWLWATRGGRGAERLLRPGAYAVRAWPKLAFAGRAVDAGGANVLATYLRQLELLAAGR